MEKLKEFWKRLNPKVAMIGGALVVTTSLGTCQLMDSGDEEVKEQAPTDAPVEEAAEPAAPAEAPEEDAKE